MNNLRILLYVIALSLTACHPNGTDVQQGLHKAAQVMEQDPDTALIILENIPLNRMNDAQRAEYNLLCTQADEDKNIPHLSDKKIRQAVSYFNTHGNEYQKSRSYYYLACVENDLGQIKAAEAHFKKAIKLAAFTKEYGYIAQVCKRCSVYYQTQGNFDGALEMERKAFANQLIRNDNDTHSGTILSAALGIVGIRKGYAEARIC